MNVPKNKVELFESAPDFSVAQKHMAGLWDKRGFEAYQCMRDFFAEILVNPEQAKVFLTDESHYRILGDFKLFDQAYIDNMSLSLSIKVTAPSAYDEAVKIIDKYVRPDPRNEGLNHLYQECGGFLAFLLEHYEGISVRQALYAAAQMTQYSESTLEKSYRARMTGFSQKLKDELPPPMTLAALYWTLHKKEAKPDHLQPFDEESSRSIGEIQKTIAAYRNFTSKAIRHYQAKVLRHLDQRPLNGIVAAGAKEYGLDFPLSEKTIQKASPFAAFYVVCAAMLIEVMPEKLEELLKNIT